MHMQSCATVLRMEGAQGRRSLGEGRRAGRGGRGGRAHAMEKLGQGRGPARGAGRKGVARRQQLLAKPVEPLQPSKSALSRSRSLLTKSRRQQARVRHARLVQAAQLLAGVVHHARRGLLNLRAAAPARPPRPGHSIYLDLDQTRLQRCSSRCRTLLTWLRKPPRPEPFPASPAIIAQPLMMPDQRF